MPLADNEKLELIELKLTEKITEQVRNRLIKTYSLFGGIAGAIITVTGWGIIQHIENVFINDLKSNVEAKAKILDKTITSAEFYAERINKINEGIESKIDESNKSLAEFNKKNEQLKSITHEIEKINIQTKELSEVQFPKLNRTAQNLNDIQLRDLDPMKKGIEAHTEQISKLTLQVEQINKLIASHSNSKSLDKEKSSQIASALHGVIAEANQSQQTIENARNKTSVFLQFSEGTRNQAKSLVEKLTGDDFIVFEPERTDLANNKHEVRYFYDEDKGAAEKLAMRTSVQLSELGFSDTQLDVKIVSLVSSPAKKPRSGVIELWLQIPKKSEDQVEVKSASEKLASELDT